MKTILDTNSLIRYFTNDIPEKAEKVKNLLENENHIIIPDVVFPELEYVLTENYQVGKTDLVKIYRFLTSRSNIKLPLHVERAVDIFECSKLDMADSIVAAISLNGTLASFDKDLLRLENVKRYWE